VTLTPSALGADNGTLSVTDSAPNSPQTAALTGTGVLPVTLTNAPANFGSVGENSPSSSKNLELRNYQAAALTISGITLSNPDYTETDNCKGSVAKGGYCIITVTLTPSALGADNGTLSVADNASNSPQTATLTGTGVLPLTLSNTLLSFGKVGENSPSAPKTTTLFNNEAVALNISITLSNPDNAETDTCKGSVAAKGYCTISVTLTPTVLGADNGTLNVTDAASNNPQTAALTGTGTGAVASLSPSRLTFTSQPVDTASVGQVIILANTGNLPLTLSATSFHLAGANADDFAQVNTCSLSLAAGNNCPIAILFTPSAVGTRGASMTITDNALGSPQSVSLSGTGTHDVILSWTPSATPGIAGYNVYRGTTSGAESATPLNFTPITGTFYTDTKVTPGVTYYYEVSTVALNEVLRSTNSTEVSATVPSP